MFPKNPAPTSKLHPDRQTRRPAHAPAAAAAVALALPLLAVALAGARPDETAPLPPDELAKVEAAAKRVPPFFGQIALTPEQRERIRDIQLEHLREIALLNKRIQTLQNQNLQQCEDVLTDVQRALLRNLREARPETPKKSRTDPKKAGDPRKSPAPEPQPPNTDAPPSLSATAPAR